ncbi:MAG TPA: DUF4160 domain-containing protein [Phycisphaerae bacterium]|nr:DUF4160 domain-containing protein [Phycisphaerae bacterium]
MSPTVLRDGPYRFYFFSREERRPHVHVESGSGEAKFWLEPAVSLALNKKMKPVELRKIQRIVELNKNALLEKWKTHFQVP